MCFLTQDCFYVLHGTFFWKTFIEHNIYSVCNILIKWTGLFLRIFLSTLFSAVLQHSDGATHQWTVTWAFTDISTRCVLYVLVCWSKLQFNTATVNVPEAHLEPRSQFKTPYSAMPCSHVFVYEYFLLAKSHFILSSSVRGINISLV